MVLDGDFQEVRKFDYYVLLRVSRKFENDDWFQARAFFLDCCLCLANPRRHIQYTGIFTFASIREASAEGMVEDDVLATDGRRGPLHVLGVRA